MTNDTNYRGKANAVFFAAVMVISMVAVGFAAAPAAAVGTSPTADPIDVGVDGQTQSVSFTAQEGTDFTVSSGASTSTVTFDAPSGLSFSGVSITNAAGASSSNDYTTNDAVTASQDGSTVTVTFDGDQINTDGQAEDINVGLDVTVDAGTASNGQYTYSITGGNSQDATFDVELTNGISGFTGTAATTDLVVGGGAQDHALVADASFDSAGDSEEITIDLGDYDSAITVNGLGSDGVTSSDSSISVQNANYDSGNSEITYELVAESASASATITTDVDVNPDSASTNEGSTLGFSATQSGTNGDFTFDVASNDADVSFSGGTSNGDIHDGNQLVFQGQSVEVTGLTPNTEVVLRERIDDSTDRTRAQFTTDSAGTVVFETENRDAGDYFLSGASAGGSLSDTFEIVNQEVTAEFDGDEVNNQGETEIDLDIESDLRPEYDFEVGADGLDEDDLQNIFDDNSFTVDQNTDDDDTVYLNGVSDDTYVANFSDIDTGDYEFNFSVTDTTAEAVDSVSVTEGTEGDVELNNQFVEGTSGDIAEIQLDFVSGNEDAYVIIGDEEDVGYEANVSVDSDGADQVTLEFNTYAAGHPAVTNVDDIFSVSTEDDDASPSINAAESEEVTGDLSGVLEAGDYELQVSDSGFDTIVADENPSDIGTLVLESSSTDDIRFWTASDDIRDDIEGVSDVQSAVDDGTLTQSEQVAADDLAVFEIQATGLTGGLDVAESSLGAGSNANQQLATLLDTENDDGTLSLGASATSDTLLDLRIRQTSDTTTANQPRKIVNEVSTIQNSGDVIVDGDNGTAYVIVDTQDFDMEQGDAPEDGDAFDVRFSNQDQWSLSALELEDDEDASDSYQRVNTQFDYLDRDGEFDVAGQSGLVELSNTENETVTGTTNVAPGTEFNVRVRSDSGVSPGFIVTETATVNEDRTFSAPGLDLSDAAVNDTFTTRFVQAGFDNDEDGVIVEQIDESQPATFEVSELDPTEATATAGDSVDVSATIENTGDVEGTQTVALTLDGDELDTTEVTLESGATQTVEFSADTSGLEAGDYTHGVATDDDEATGTLTIEASGDDSSGDDSSGDDSSGDDSSGDDSSGDDSSGDDSSGDSEGDSTDDGTPGFGALVALVALIAAALLATRRND